MQRYYNLAMRDGGSVVWYDFCKNGQTEMDSILILLNGQWMGYGILTILKKICSERIDKSAIYSFQVYKNRLRGFSKRVESMFRYFSLIYLSMMAFCIILMFSGKYL